VISGFVLIIFFHKLVTVIVGLQKKTKRIDLSHLSEKVKSFFEAMNKFDDSIDTRLNWHIPRKTLVISSFSMSIFIIFFF
jgi:hypothetical protein